MDQKREVIENAMEGGFFIFILLRYIFFMFLKQRDYIEETNLKLYLVKRMLGLIIDFWPNLMSFMFVQSVSPRFIPPWRDVFKGQKYSN